MQKSTRKADEITDYVNPTAGRHKKAKSTADDALSPRIPRKNDGWLSKRTSPDKAAIDVAKNAKKNRRKKPSKPNNKTQIKITRQGGMLEDTDDEFTPSSSSSKCYLWITLLRSLMHLLIF